MIARLLPFLLVLGVLGLVPAHAERAASCTSARSQPAAVDQIVRNAAAWKGRCVAVTAMSDGYQLYSGVEGYYRAGRAGFGDRADDPNAHGRIGLDNHRLMARIPREQFHEVTAIGRVQDCDEMREIAQASLGPDEIGWVSGYCHTAFGPVIWLSDIRVRRPFARPRHMGEEARAAYGDLLFAPDNWPQRAHVMARSEAFLEALRGGDRRAFADLHDRGVNPTAGEAAARFAFGTDSPFAEVARRGDRSQTAIFVRRDDLSWPNARAATICFCRLADCTDRWPISSLDADNRPDRPYVCTYLTPWDRPGRSEEIFITEQNAPGFAEPAATAFRRPSESSRR